MFLQDLDISFHHPYSKESWVWFLKTAFLFLNSYRLWYHQVHRMLLLAVRWRHERIIFGLSQLLMVQRLYVPSQAWSATVTYPRCRNHTLAKQNPRRALSQFTASLCLQFCLECVPKIRLILSTIFREIYVGLCVCNLPISLVMITRIRVHYLVIIIKADVWPICHYLGLGHETTVCTVCHLIILQKLLWSRLLCVAEIPNGRWGTGA